MVVETMLLVEDDEVFAQVICRAMRKRGYEIQHACSLEEGIRAVNSGCYDHAVLDLNLGGHSSLPLIPMLKGRNPEMNILVLTGYASIATAVDAIKLGASNYLANPADADDILAALVQNPEPQSDQDVSILEPMSVRRLE